MIAEGGAACDVGAARALGDVELLARLLDGHAANGVGDLAAEIERADTAHGLTPLMKAAAEGHADVVRLLLARGAQAGVGSPRDDGNDAALGVQSCLCCRRGGDDAAFVECATALIEAGAPLEEHEFLRGHTPLLRAAARGHRRLVETLLDVHGARADVRDADGGSALMLAAAAGHEGVTRMLLKRADVEKEAVDKFKQTAAHRACLGGHARVVPLLAAAKCNLDACDVAGETPMLLAAELGLAEAVASLIANGASTNLMSHERETPLSAAIMGKHVDAIKALLDADGPQKVRLSHRDAVGRTALMRAVSMDHTEMVQILLASGAPVGQGERGGSSSGGPGGSGGGESGGHGGGTCLGYAADVLAKPEVVRLLEAAEGEVGGAVAAVAAAARIETSEAAAAVEAGEDEASKPADPPPTPLATAAAAAAGRPSLPGLPAVTAPAKWVSPATPAARARRRATSSDGGEGVVRPTAQRCRRPSRMAAEAELKAAEEARQSAAEAVAAAEAAAEAGAQAVQEAAAAREAERAKAARAALMRATRRCPRSVGLTSGGRRRPMARPLLRQHADGETSWDVPATARMAVKRR